MPDPEPSDRAYFLYHSIGQYPGKAAELARAMAAFADDWGAADDGQWARVLAARDEFLAAWGALIGAPEGTLATAETVTSALHRVMGALPDRHLAGRRVLVAADCFPSLHFLLAGMAERRRFALDTVHPREGEAWVRDEDVIARWDAGVGAALLTLATSTASHRPDLAALTAHGRAMGSLVGVDLTQGVGILPYALGDPAPDFAVSTSLKWLCGTPGAGVLHVAPWLLPDCRPELRGWFGQDDPFQWELDRFAFAEDARRFDHGTPSVLPCVGTLPALCWHAAQDARALLAHTRALGAAVIEGARGLGLPLACPEDEARRGGSVMLHLGPDAGAVVATLRAERVHVDCRGPVLRVSPGAMTTEAHVERLLAGLHRHGAGRQALRAG